MQISFLNKDEDNSSKVNNTIKNSIINAPVQQAQTIFNTHQTPDRSDLIFSNFEIRARELFKNTSHVLKITHNVGDQDAKKLADKLANIFKSIGWVIEGPIIDMIGSIPDGIHIRVNFIDKVRQDFADLIKSTGFLLNASKNGKTNDIEIFIGRK